MNDYKTELCSIATAVTCFLCLLIVCKMKYVVCGYCSGSWRQNVFYMLQCCRIISCEMSYSVARSPK